MGEKTKKKKKRKEKKRKKDEEEEEEEEEERTENQWSCLKFYSLNHKRKKWIKFPNINPEPH